MAAVGDLRLLAPDRAGFLTALRRIDPACEPARGPRTFFRGGPLHGRMRPSGRPSPDSGTPSQRRPRPGGKGCGRRPGRGNRSGSTTASTDRTCPSATTAGARWSTSAASAPVAPPAARCWRGSSGPSVARVLPRVARRRRGHLDAAAGLSPPTSPGGAHLLRAGGERRAGTGGKAHHDPFHTPPNGPF